MVEKILLTTSLVKVSLVSFVIIYWIIGAKMKEVCLYFPVIYCQTNGKDRLI